MGQILIVAREENIEACTEIAEQYDVSFELNDFFNPEVLEHEEELNRLVTFYQNRNLPKSCTMHGAFFDIVVFSYDPRVREIAELRMEQSMKIAVRLGVKGVVFHTNISPVLSGEEYDQRAIEMTVEYMACLLQRYPDTCIYLENMFDANPDILVAISERLCVYDNYGVCFDYAHARLTNTPIEQWVEALSPYIKHVHINDNYLKRDEHLALGDGGIDWGKFVELRNQYFRDSSLLIETTLPEDQRRSLEYLERNFEGVVKRK